MREKIVLVDGHSILNRAFYGLPLLTNTEGVHTNAVLGFLNILFKALEEEKPQYLAVAFDLAAPTFRHKMFDAYKGTRSPMPQELRDQVPLMKEVLTAMGVPLMSLEGYEADDLIGTVSLQMEEAGLDVRILSGDRDLLQLASDTTMVRIPKTKKTGREVEDYLSTDVVEKYGVTPAEFVHVKALMGDASDNIPGIPGVGEKTATKIIAAFHTIGEAHDHLDQVTPPTARRSLEENWDLAQLSYKLALINRHAPFTLSLDQAAIGEGGADLYTSSALDVLKRLQLRQLADKFAARRAQMNPQRDRLVQADGLTEQAKSAGLPDGPATAWTLLEDPARTDAFIEKAREADRMGLFLLGEEDRLLGAAVTAGSQSALLLSVTKDQLVRLVSGRGRICGINLIEGLRYSDDGTAYPEEVQGRYFDCAIGAYLLNPLAGSYLADDISLTFTGRILKSREELLGKKSLREVCGLAKGDLSLLMSGEDKPARKAAGPDTRDGARAALLTYACQASETACLCAEPITVRLKEEGMYDLFSRVEMPLVFTLYHMEQEGILVRRDQLEQFSQALSERIGQLEEEIYSLAGKPFNVNSPKQLGTVLFEDLKLPAGKKTKSGYSTSADVLDHLAEDYPIVGKILDYRQLTKLKSTYADGLVPYISDDGRIHGKFRQTVTATGRISSADPNLQNIPIRTDLGSQLRAVFVPKEGSTFIDADYSQIELRVLASASGDENLIEAYNSAEDIHAVTASKVFHVPLDQVTSQLRRNAKAVNFGIVYGISSFGLSQGLSISAGEAQTYIDQYFRTYPGIKAYLDGCIESAKTRGYSVTLFGRRRPVPELKEKNFMRRKFGERVAMNAPIQGTAADIIKIAMVGVDRRLRREGMQSRLILQVHDELLIETALGESEKVSRILTEEMEGAADLKVRLEIDQKEGESWLEAH